MQEKDIKKGEGVVDINTIIESVESSDFPLTELSDAIGEKVSQLKLGDIMNAVNNKGLKKLKNTQVVDKEDNKRTKELTEYFAIKKEFKDSTEVINESNGVQYLKYNDEIFKVLESNSNTYITYNVLNSKYSIFSYDGTDLIPLLLDIEHIEKTDINNWWKIIENKLEYQSLSSIFDKNRSYCIGGYYFMGNDGKTQYLNGGSDFSELDEHGNIIYFEADRQYAGSSIIIASNEKSDSIHSGFTHKITLNNGRNFLLISYNLCDPNQTQSLYDADNMELLLDNVLSIKTNREENTVEYIIEENRIFTVVQKALGKKKATKTLDLN